MCWGSEYDKLVTLPVLLALPPAQWLTDLRSWVHGGQNNDGPESNPWPMVREEETYRWVTTYDDTGGEAKGMGDGNASKQE